MSKEEAVMCSEIQNRALYLDMFRLLQASNTWVGLDKAENFSKNQISQAYQSFQCIQIFLRVAKGKANL